MGNELNGGGRKLTPILTRAALAVDEALDGFSLPTVSDNSAWGGCRRSVSIAVSFAFGLGLFVALPHLITIFIEKYYEN